MQIQLAMITTIRHIMLCTTALSLIALGAPRPVGAIGPDEPEPRGWLGVQLEADSAEVSAVIPDSPADGSLRQGDRILKVSGKEVESLKSLRDALTGHAPGDRITVVVRRRGANKTFDVVLGAVPSPSDITEARLEGRTLPEFSVRRIEASEQTDVRTITLASLKGTFTLIEFWATWCPPCETTRTFLTELKQTHGSSLQILAISPESPETIRRVVAEHDLPYHVARDQGATAQKAFGVGQLPTIVAVDADGTVVDVFVGAGHRDAIRDLLERRLKESISR